MNDRLERIPLGERWIQDAFAISPQAGGMALRLVDMTQAKRALQALRERGLQATYTHLIVRAAALALIRNPDLHQLVCNYHRSIPGTVDIGLSMAGETAYAPVVVLKEADRKRLPELVPFANETVATGRIKEKVDLENMRRQAWVIPFGFLRRWFLRRVQHAFWFRRKLAGTFQVSVLPHVDVVAPFLFYTGSLLGAGHIQDRVLAVNGTPVVRLSVWLSVCIDHASMDGRRAAMLLTAVKDILEGEELLAEARAPGSAQREPPPLAEVSMTSNAE